MVSFPQVSPLEPYAHLSHPPLLFLPEENITSHITELVRREASVKGTVRLRWTENIRHTMRTGRRSRLHCSNGITRERLTDTLRSSQFSNYKPNISKYCCPMGIHVFYLFFPSNIVRRNGSNINLTIKTYHKLILSYPGPVTLLYIQHLL